MGLTDKYSRKSKVLYILCFILFAVYIYAIFNIKLIGYETSYYENIPLWYTVFPAFSFLIYSYIVITKDVSKKYILLIYISYICILIPLLWYIKYGRFYGYGDIYVHLNFVTDILKNGYYPSNLVYPLLHIYLTIISLIVRSNNYLIFIGFNFIIYPLYIIIIYIFCKVLYFKDTEIYLSMAFCVLNPFVIIETSAITPYLYSEIILLLALYVMIRQKFADTVSLHYILIIIGLSLVTSHIISAFVLIGTYIIYYISTHISIKYDFMNLRYIPYKKSGNYIILLSVLLLFWIYVVNRSAEHLMSGMFQTIYNAFFADKVSIEQVSITTRSPINFLYRRINLVSEIFLTLTSLIYIFLRKEKTSKEHILMYLSIYLFLGMILYMFMTRFAAQEFGISARFIYNVALLFPLYIGYLLSEITTSNKTSKSINYFIVIFFVVTFFSISLITQYPRTDYGYYNPYTTDNDILGMEWGYRHIDWNNSKIMGGGDHFESLSLSLIGDKTYPTMKGSTNGLIDFLGENSSNYEHRGLHDKYISEGKKEYVYYEPLMSYFVANPKYTDKIFTVNEDNLSNKASLQKIYINGAFTTYYKT